MSWFPRFGKAGPRSPECYSSRPAGEAGPLNTFLPFDFPLFEIGEAISCSRMPHETTKAYAHRLAQHIQAELNEREQLLARVLAHTE